MILCRWEKARGQPRPANGQAIAAALAASTLGGRVAEGEDASGVLRAALAGANPRQPKVVARYFVKSKAKRAKEEAAAEADPAGQI